MSTNQGCRRTAMLLVSILAGTLASRTADAQDEWRLMATDTVQVRTISLSREALVWVEVNGIPPGGGFTATVGGAVGTTVPLPVEGMILSAGSHLFTLTPYGDLLPDSALVRIRTAAVTNLAGTAADTLRLELEMPVRWTGAEGRTFRVRMPHAGTVVAVIAGNAGRLTWLDADGQVRMGGGMIQVPGPDELIAQLPGSSEGTSVLAFRSFQSVDDLEPNNDPFLASTVTLDEWLTISIGHVGDVDHLSVDLPSAGTLAVQWRAVPRGIAPSVRLLREEGDLVPLPTMVARGRHTVRVEAAPGEWSPAAFGMRLRFTASGAMSEPPERQGPARLNWMSPVTLRLAAPSHRDSAYFLVRKRGVVRLFVQTGDPALRPSISIRRGEEIVAAERPELGIRVDTGTYTVVLAHDIQAAAGTGTMTLRAEFFPESDPHEPNDHPASATVLKLPARLEALLEGPGDEDWFLLSFPKSGVFRLRQAAGALLPSIPLRFQLRTGDDPELVVESRTFVGSGLDLQFLVDSGAYFLRAWSVAPSSQPYAFDLTFQEEQGLNVKGGLFVAMIGLALGERDAFLRQTALSSGALYLAADDTAALYAAVDTASARMVASLAGTRWALAALLVCVAVVVLASALGWRRHSTRSRSRQSAAASSQVR